MQNKFFGSKLNTILLLILIILVVWAISVMLRNEETYLPVLQTNNSDSDATKQVVYSTNSNEKDTNKEISYEEYMSSEAKWAFSEENNGLPKGWETWPHVSGGVSIAPAKNSSSYIVMYDAKAIENGSKWEGECHVVGIGGEINQKVYCVVGYDLEVLRFWNVVNYFK